MFGTLLRKSIYLLTLAGILIFLPQDVYGIEISATPAASSFGPNDWIQIMLEIDGYIGGTVEWIVYKPDSSTDSGFLENLSAGKKTHSITRNAFDNQFGTWSIEYNYKDVSKKISVIVDPIILQVTTDKETYLAGDTVIFTLTSTYYDPIAAYAENYFIEILDGDGILAKQMDDIVLKVSQASIVQEFLIDELLDNNPHGKYKIAVQYYNVFAETSFEVVEEDLSISVFVGTDKAVYDPGDVVELNLVISDLVGNDVLIKITDPSGKTTEKSLPVKTTLTRVLLDDVSITLPGTYSIEVEYAGFTDNKTFVVKEKSVAPIGPGIELTLTLDKMNYRPGEALSATVNTDSLLTDNVSYWFEDPSGAQKRKISVPMTSGSIVIPITISKNTEQGPWKMYVDYGGAVDFTIFFVEGDPVDQAEITSVEEAQEPEVLMIIGPDKTSLKNPSGIAIDSNQDIYVVDSGNSQVKKFDANGKLLASWGVLGSAEGEFKNPTGILVDSDFVHVADTDNSRIQTFEKDGSFVRSWGDPRIESQYPKRPVAISMDASGIFYVSDMNLNKILKFDSNGDYAGYFEPIKTIRAKFSSSDFIISDNRDNFFILVSKDSKIVLYGANGNFINSFGIIGKGDGEFQSPSAMAIDSKGYLYIADSGNSRIQVFDPYWKFVGKWGLLGTGPGEFNQISGIAVDSQDNVYVVDSAKNWVQKFPPFTEKGGLQIPDWVRNNAKWWTEGMIADNDFASGIQFMIKEKIIVIPELAESGESTDQRIPDWVKNNARWWASGQISDKDFAAGIQYLVEQGIIKV